MQLFLLYLMCFKFDVIHATSPQHRLSFRSPHPPFTHNRVGKYYSVLMLLLNYNPTLNKINFILSYLIFFNKDLWSISLNQCLFSVLELDEISPRSLPLRTHEVPPRQFESVRS